MSYKVNYDDYNPLCSEAEHCYTCDAGRFVQEHWDTVKNSALLATLANWGACSEGLAWAIKQVEQKPETTPADLYSAAVWTDQGWVDNRLAERSTTLDDFDPTQYVTEEEKK